MSDSKASHVSWWRAVMISPSHLRAAGWAEVSEREVIKEVGRCVPHGPTCPPRVGGLGWPLVAGEIGHVLLMRVACSTQPEGAARVLPRLPLAVPVKANLRQLLAMRAAWANTAPVWV